MRTTKTQARQLLTSKGIPEEIINLFQDKVSLHSFKPTIISPHILIPKIYDLASFTDEQAQDLADRYHEAVNQ